MSTVLVPLRDPADAKQRLAPAMNAAERQQLATTMFAAVVGCLRRTAGVDEVVVLAGTPAARHLAGRLGLRSVADPRTGPRRLNAAVDAALRLPWPGPIAVIMADLPWLRPEEVETLLQVPEEVAVAVSRDGGTSGLRLRSGVLVEAAFGPGSAARHLRRARAQGLSTVELRSPGFMADVDEPADLSGEAPMTPTRLLRGRSGQPAIEEALTELSAWT